MSGQRFLSNIPWLSTSALTRVVFAVGLRCIELIGEAREMVRPY